jgi:hypothetical protein
MAISDRTMGILVGLQIPIENDRSKHQITERNWSDLELMACWDASPRQRGVALAKSLQFERSQRKALLDGC